MVTEFQCGAKSNHIERVRYDSDSLDLEVHFKDSSTATYAKVPDEVYVKLKEAKSVGTYFHRVIQVHYRQTSRTYPEKAKPKPYGSHQAETPKAPGA